jgi:hypothetical protein
MTDVSKKFLMNRSGEFKYFSNFNFDAKLTSHFIASLEDGTLYTLIPLISISGLHADPYLILSKQIIISKYSNHNIINGYLANRLLIVIEQFGLSSI